MQSLAVVAERFGVWVSVIERAAVAGEFVANRGPPEHCRALRGLLAAYVARTRTAFANAQTTQSAGAAIADAATSAAYRFRWQTSSQAQSLVGVSLADHDGDRVLNLTRPWISCATRRS